MMLGITVICWFAGFALLWKAPHLAADMFPKRRGDAEKKKGEKTGSESSSQSLCVSLEGSLGGLGVDVVIPARNEERALPRLLESIASQNGCPADVIVVDDDSTDATAAVAQAAGATVITAGPLPEGWRGKTWGCHQGAKNAAGANLLFLDADAWFEPGGLARILEKYGEKPAVLSVLPYHIVPSLIEQLSAFFNLIMAASVGEFGLFARQPDGLFGQMMLIDRQTYLAVDGYERVRQHVLENLHLAKHLKAGGAMLRCFSGRGCLSMRMYPNGFRELVSGWSKGFASGAGATTKIDLALTIVWLTGAVTAAGGLRTHSPASMTVYALFVAQLFYMLRQIGSYWLVTAIFYPIPLIFFFAVFGRSVLRSGSTVSWKGRTFNAAG